ncbi:MAG: endonuclease/exonuclease/phosphatase family protein [Candidatus Thiodiazotropha sp.]|nr:endonuclease/exonuclease/phosphatase family protein [Candidatus Thiodiazotropha sp.]MCU7802249.1 endonuclease/exonuclease/phosphatase family protein [Candidatus Thiodiazotropha sp. (ex Lucinoma borealis)]MCU7838297.1 endonuclease/exonuclease/phosphatase family protein [Candidatus Thiodiazotropha sp. (ex Troendleina suluensis)]MCU7883925.1 endonuclease/exonuclease/phosphatase family protein [Candidatus Thiodiazotropha sp. (ex Lucinoma annulata)]MCM8882126.1 endonuclease/exonuclease/phosphatas
MNNQIVQNQTSLDGSYRLRLLSYNIQAGADTRRYREYVTSSWKQMLPHKQQQENLNRIAHLLKDFDVVGLQEVDSGSFRSGFVDQTAYLAKQAGFPYWYRQVNRKLGKLAQHSNGILSRVEPRMLTEHRLPGLPGRGAVLMEFQTNEKPLGICMMHLALGRRARLRQLSYVSDLVSHYSHLVLMGDFNCGCSSQEFRYLIERTNLQGSACDMMTFPSWRPSRKLDHILASPSLKVSKSEVLNYAHSDHLPISLEIELPKDVVFPKAA